MVGTTEHIALSGRQFVIESDDTIQDDIDFVAGLIALGEGFATLQMPFPAAAVE
jgi:hypothetical protein